MKITLPSGTRVAVAAAFVESDELPLADYHVLRAVATKLGLREEEPIEFTCHNCEAPLTAKPCALLETGPWEHGEANDPELDLLLTLNEPHTIVPVPIARVRIADTVTFAPRTAKEAAPLRVLEGPLKVDAAFVKAIGISALGTVKDPRRIARALADCSDEAFASVTDCWLATHYVPRLAADVFCPKCKARNTVDAPADREFERGELLRAVDGKPLPPLADFVELAHAIAEPLLAEDVELLVEDGTPAVDDGGESLLGSYVPPPPKDAPVPMRPGTVTVYYRTFAAIEREEGVFDWEGELRETIAHELEHHEYFLRGHDPMDEEEHDEIDREALRIVGREEAKRRVAATFGSSMGDFFIRAWPLVVIAAAVLLLTIAQDRC